MTKESEYRSVYAFDMSTYQKTVDVGKADINDFACRAPALVEPGAMIMYDADRPFPPSYIEFMSRKGLGAYKYLAVKSGRGSFFERALHDQDVRTSLLYTQRQDGRPLLLKPYNPRGDAEWFAAEMGMRSYFGPATRFAARLCNKATVRRLSLELGLPTTDGIICSGALAIRHFAQEFLARGETVVVKEQLINGASATGFVFLTTQSDLGRYLETADLTREVLVERWHRTKVPSPSMIVEIQRGTVRVLGFTDQILTPRGKYCGNSMPGHMSPSQRAACKRYGKTLGRRVAMEGYQGVFGMDFIIDDEDETIRISEANFRFVGSSFLHGVVKRLGHKGAATCTVLNGLDGMEYADVQRVIDELDLKPGQHVIPHNVRCYQHGEGALIILAETEKAVAELYGAVLGPLLRKKYGSHLPKTRTKASVALV